MQSRSAKAGLVAILIFSFAYGYGLSLLIDAAQARSSCNWNEFAGFVETVLGILAGALIFPVVSIGYALLAPRLWGMEREAGCTLVLILSVTAAVVGFWLFGALPLFRLARWC